MYCAAHAAQRDKLSSATQRGYGARWRRLRAAYLAEHPICADPLGHHAGEGRVEAATDVDHIVARERGGTDEDRNLQALCHACHSEKTAREDGRWG